MNIIRCMNGKQDGKFSILDEKWMINAWMLEE
jgi:hypothetical protein